MLIYVLLFITNLVMIITIFLLVSEKKQYALRRTLQMSGANKLLKNHQKKFNSEYSIIPNMADRVILEYSKQFSFRYPEGEQTFWLTIENINGTSLKTKSYSAVDRHQAMFDFGNICVALSKKGDSRNEKTKIFLNS